MQTCKSCGKPIGTAEERVKCLGDEMRSASQGRDPTYRAAIYSSLLADAMGYMLGYCTTCRCIL